MGILNLKVLLYLNSKKLRQCYSVKTKVIYIERTEIEDILIRENIDCPPANIIIWNNDTGNHRDFELRLTHYSEDADYKYGYVYECVEKGYDNGLKLYLIND